MMEPADELLLSEATPLSHVVEKDPRCINHPERRMFTVIVAAVANLVFTVLLLCPADTDAWYHVDAYQSPRGSENVERVLAVRPSLIVLAVVGNSFFVLAAYLKLDALLSVYICAALVLDVWSLVLLLPHALFLMRFLFDALLIAIALEVRTHLEHTWFLTSFHRLRA
ncbi:hypothetical protein PHYSODRAFT_330170 [Phytophthora sojae]|uniref:Transmembrane protein n=1 Tax=Phytophthora sojae (strain P6497) TaxID=1094619 RepID=G4Z5N8_PHYSP|nr:hypothetical protein PHYSODRAFT_330170 [Phytophthora sojae]EGZ22352.1 hypothetical protein PHYSODRAFT_330170 [Phytophthora sojae]|eukprot:XP_009525069.1 hypothetical protein PHYSODRAFT_330170 [Phytophthora sojae]